MTTIRAAVPGDAARLVALDTVAEHSAGRAAAIAEWLAGDLCRVAERDGAIVGYATVTRAFFHQPFVEMVMVAAEARRSGVGRALLGHCIAVAGTEKLWTSTNRSNAPMRALLAQTGFIESGIIENLDAGDPELVFVHLPTQAG